MTVTINSNASSFGDNEVLSMGDSEDVKISFDGTDLKYVAAASENIDLDNMHLTWTANKALTAADVGIGRSGDGAISLNGGTGSPVSAVYFKQNNTSYLSFSRATVTHGSTAPVWTINDDANSSGVRFNTTNSASWTWRWQIGGGTKFAIRSTGDVGIGATASVPGSGGMALSFGVPLEGGAALDIVNVTMGANSAGLFAKNHITGTNGYAELFSVDEQDNVAQLTPHAFDFDVPDSYTYPWTYTAENKVIGKRINVDMYGAIRAVEALASKTFIYLTDIEKRSWDDLQTERATERAGARTQAIAEGEDDPGAYVKKDPPDWIAARE